MWEDQPRMRVRSAPRLVQLHACARGARARIETLRARTRAVRLRAAARLSRAEQARIRVYPNPTAARAGLPGTSTSKMGSTIT